MDATRLSQRKGNFVTQYFPGAMVSLLLLSGITWSQEGAGNDASTPRLHSIDAQTSTGLRELFHFEGESMPLLSAHRGGAIANYPENCIATFEHTLQHAYAMLEIDLQYTKDGEIVLHHDQTLERTTTGTGRVRELTLNELKRLRLKDRDGKVTDHVIPTLDEALEWARGKTILVLDKKEVPVKACVEKIAAHKAEAFAMVLAYSFDDVRTCHELNDQIMMEVILGNRDRFNQFNALGVPWSHVFVFVSHSPPQDLQLLQMIHAKGTFCMAGTSRNLDRQLRSASDKEETATLKRDYLGLLQQGVDLIETDLPVQVSDLIYQEPMIPASKATFFHLR